MASPFTSKDGSRFTNRSTMVQHESRQKAKGGSPSGRMAAGMGQGMSQSGSDAGGQGEEPDANDGAAMAAEHGPATELDIQHDEASGSHTVHAQHPDGHQHDTQHGSAAEAHKYAADCAGVGAEAGGMSGGMSGE